MRKTIKIIIFFIFFIGLTVAFCTLPYVVKSDTGSEAEFEMSDLRDHEKEAESDKKVQKVEKETDFYNELEDNKYLYDGEDDSVVTMYLTVSKGNASDGTDNTWDFINKHSVYYYERKGIERAAVNGLLQVGNEDGVLEGELGYGINIPNATVTIRGQTSSRNTQKSYKIKLKNGEWNEQEVINLNKHQMDGVRFRNKLMYKLAQDVPGLMSMQTQFVHLYVKDLTEGYADGFRDYGLYTQVEQPNRRYLKRHGLDKNGHLYKINMFEFYENDDVIKLKNESGYDEKEFEKLLEIKGNDDHKKLIAMIKDVNDVSVPIEKVLDKWFDRKNIFNWLAFNIITGNTDTQSRNTLLYSPLNGNKWYFLLWDCDSAFTNNERRLYNKYNNQGWENGVSNYFGNMLFKRILKNSKLRQEIDDAVSDMLDLITQKKVQKLVDTYSKVTEQYIYNSIDVFKAPLTREQFRKICEEIPGELQENYDLYKKSLSKPMPFFIAEPEKKNDKILFKWQNSYTFDASDVTYTLELADNYEFKDEILKEEGLYIPKYRLDEELNPGQYFVRVTAKNSMGEEQYAFDYYVSREEQKYYGIKCFYVHEDGSIEEEEYIE